MGWRHPTAAVNSPEENETVVIPEFEGLVREHQASLRAFVRALGVDEAWVDDVAQEAFIVAHRRFAEFQAGTDFGKWVRTIARNLAVNERRKEARRSRLVPAVIADLLLRHEDEVDADFAGLGIGRMITSLKDCVGRLTPRSQELIRRRYTAGETALALAREFGMKPDALRQALLRIRLTVKKCIETADEGVLP
jgi:RNA polymerase sigma-70 factor, ECF subfamily